AFARSLAFAGIPCCGDSMVTFLRTLLVLAACQSTVALRAQVAIQTDSSSAPRSGNPWWKDAVIYEIYPRSFQDSNGDGIGDINGITSRLDYLKDLGVDAIWITPMYPSPQVDFGYDIAEHTAIDAQYGSMSDFDHLMSETKKRNIRVIMDYVANHTS